MQALKNLSRPIQITDGCEGYVLGDTEFSFQLTVMVLNENTTGFYRASATNAAGTAEVERTFVTGRGEIYMYIDYNIYTVHV